MLPPSTPTDLRPSGARWVLPVALLLLGLHAVLALHSTLTRSVTVDEIFHVTGGYVFNREGDFRIQPENGVLPQRLHALPALLLGAKPPPYADSAAWRASDMFVVSHQFFYEVGNDHWPMLIGARLINLGFSTALCLLVFAWARSLAGPVAGLTALALAACSPTLLAHGPLATSDVVAAFFLTASASAFWWQLRQPGWPHTVLSALVFGLACVSKFSAVLLLPIFTLLLAVHAWRRSEGAWPFRQVLLAVAAHGAAAFALIWLFYGLRFAANAPHLPPAERFETAWRIVLHPIGWQAPVLTFLRHWHVLPDAFLYGYAHTYMSSLSRAAFLAGEYSFTGWKSFFPLAFLWKSTPAELLGAATLLAGAFLRGRRLAAWLPRLAPLAVLGGVYGLAAVTSHLNIGHRHILPLYPLLFIGTGVALVRLLPRSARIAAGLLALLQAAAAGGIHPYHLAYFNPLAGGPDHGWRLLVDSSLDWGQDLPALRDWLDQHNREGAPVHLSYFGSGEPAYHGVRATNMLAVNGFKIPVGWYDPGPGIYAVSATALQGVYSPVGPTWTDALEKEFQELRQLDASFRRFFVDEAFRAAQLEKIPESRWTNAWQRYEILRQARLCSYLRLRGPDGAAGHSILLFRLTADEVRTVFHGSASAWLQAVEDAARRLR